MIRYFEMSDDMHVPGRWFLSDPKDRNGRLLDRVFSNGEHVQFQGPIRVDFNPHISRGRPVDYSELSIESAPVVHVRVASILAELAPSDIQLVPVLIEGQPDQFVIVNVTRVVRCIDERRSAEIKHYTEKDVRVFGDRIGEYKSVIGMRIDPGAPGNAKIFRPWGWEVTIVVSEDIKDALERIQTIGVKFKEV